MPQALLITPDYYDLMVDWAKRLDREGPFYRRLFDQLGARRVLDAACGTGQHLILFSGWGLSCTGSDADAEMIARARANSQAAGVALDLFVAPFADLPARVSEPFDVVLCVGNSLSMVPESEVEASVAGLAAAVRPGGALVVHVLNALRFAKPGAQFLPLQVRERDGRTVLFQKVFEPRADGLGVHFLVIAQQADGAWSSGVDSNVIANRAPDRMQALLQAVGLGPIESFGNYRGAPFKPSATDLIMVARKP